MAHDFLPRENVKYACEWCNCEEYPSCSYEDEFCSGCIDGITGHHLVILSDGSAVLGRPEWYLYCQSCDEYWDPDDDEPCQAHEYGTEREDEDIDNEDNEDTEDKESEDTENKEDDENEDT